MKKIWIIFKQDCGMKLEFKLWFSSLQPWKPHTKLLTKLAAYCSKYQPTQETNVWARAKADAATKMLWIIPIASIFYPSNGSNHMAWKE